MPEVKPAWIQVYPDDPPDVDVLCRECGPLATGMSWKESVDIREEHNLFHDKKKQDELQVLQVIEPIGYMVFQRRPAPALPGEWVWTPASTCHADLAVANALLSEWSTDQSWPDSTLHVLQLVVMPTPEPEPVRVTYPPQSPAQHLGEGEDG